MKNILQPKILGGLGGAIVASMTMAGTASAGAIWLENACFPFEATSVKATVKSGDCKGSHFAHPHSAPTPVVITRKERSCTFEIKVEPLGAEIVVNKLAEKLGVPIDKIIGDKAYDTVTNQRYEGATIEISGTQKWMLSYTPKKGALWQCQLTKHEF